MLRTNQEEHNHLSMFAAAERGEENDEGEDEDKHGTRSTEHGEMREERRRGEHLSLLRTNLRHVPRDRRHQRQTEPRKVPIPVVKGQGKAVVKRQ